MRKNTLKKILAALLALGIISALTACNNSSSSTVSLESSYAESYSEFKWPDSKIASLIPTPKSNIGKIKDDSSNFLCVYVSNTTKNQFSDYIDECKKKGFTVDYNKGDDYYYAKNEDGYNLDIRYKDDNVMEIVLSEPYEESSTTSTTSKTESSKSEQSSSSKVESTTSKPKTESKVESKSESSKPKEESSKSKSDNIIDPKFKEAMDSYEEFINEYVDFMKKYHANPTNATLINEYAEYTSKYAEMLKKFNEWEDEDLNSAETAYYIDVQARVSKKLVAVSYEIS